MHEHVARLDVERGIRDVADVRLLAQDACEPIHRLQDVRLFQTLALALVRVDQNGHRVDAAEPCDDLLLHLVDVTAVPRFREIVVNRVAVVLTDPRLSDVPGEKGGDGDARGDDELAELRARQDAADQVAERAVQGTRSPRALDLHV